MKSVGQMNLNTQRLIQKNSQKANQGFTLIELMISISILSMLLFTGSYTYSLLSTRWDKELGDFSQTVNKAKNQQLTQNLLAGIQTFVITDNKQRPSFFFIGHKKSVLAVSRGGIFSNDFPEIFRLTAIEKENGLFDLVYQSASTKNILLTNTQQEIDFTQQLVLFSDLTQVSFSYLGWSHVDEKSAETLPSAKWFETFSGIDNQLMPIEITLTLTNDKGLFFIPIELDQNPELRLSPYYEGE
jgi:prepilin-type N-terminal cleavage/methylation domain-containing protein